MPSSSRPPEITSRVAAILASSTGWRNGSQSTRWPMRIVDVRAASARRDRQAFERVDLGRRRRGEVVHQPHRVESGGLGRERAFEDAVERHPQLRQVDAKPRFAHGVRTLASGSSWSSSGRERDRHRVARAASAPRPSPQLQAAGARVAVLDRARRARCRRVVAVRRRRRGAGRRRACARPSTVSAALDVAVVNAGIGGMGADPRPEHARSGTASCA